MEASDGTKFVQNNIDKKMSGVKLFNIEFDMAKEKAQPPMRQPNVRKAYGCEHKNKPLYSKGKC